MSSDAILNEICKLAVYLHLELSIFMVFMLFVCVCQTFNKEFNYLLTWLES